MSSTCDFNLVADVTGLTGIQSNLHKKLIKDYPESVNDEGVSSYYVHVRTNENFIEEFGQVGNKSYSWLDKKGHKKLRKLTMNAGVFNDQGEPQLHKDSVGPYILKPSGDVYYLNEDSVGISSQEYMDGINTLTGAYLNTDSKVEVATYVASFLEARVLTLEAAADAVNQSIPLKKGKAVYEAYELEEAIREKADKIQNFLDTPSVLNAFVKRINLRIESQSFKVVQTIGDKEDDGFDTQEDTINFTKESNETSNRALDDIEIIKFLSSIPIFEKYDANILNQEKKKNSLFGGDLFMAPAAARSLIEDVLSNSLVNAPGESPFQNYLNKLRTYVTLSEHPELHHIYKFLNNLSDNVEDVGDFKVKFYSAMDKATQNFAITLVTKERGTLNLQVVDPALVNNKVGKITSSLIEHSVNVEDRGIPEISIIIHNAKKKFKSVKSSAKPAKYVEFLKELLVEQLGLPLHGFTIDRLVAHNTLTTNGFTDFNKLIDQLLTTPIRHPLVDSHFIDPPKGELEIIKDLLDPRRGKEDLKSYLMRPNTFFRTLATYEAIYQVKNSEASVFVGSKQRWLYSFKSFLQIELEKIKRGLSTRLTELEDRGLSIVNFLLDADQAELDNIRLITNTELKTKNDPNPSLHKKISPVDLHLDIFIKMFNSQDEFHAGTTSKKQGVGSKKAKEAIELMNYLIYNFGADKNSLFAIHGVPNPATGNSKLYNAKSKKLGKDFKRIVRGYVIGEIKRSIKDSQVVADYMENPSTELLMETLIPGYHYKTDKNVEEEELTGEDFQRGLYYKAGLFTDSLDKFTEENYNLVYKFPKGSGVAPIFRNSFISGRDGDKSSFDKFMGIVYDDLNTIIKKNYEALNNLTLINRENEEGEMVNKKLFDVSTNIDFKGNKDLALYSYITSSFMVGYELSNLFNGHISYYKQKGDKITLDDFLKRAPAAASNGRYMYTDRSDLTEKTYTTYEGEQVEVIANKNIVAAIVNDISSEMSQYAKLISEGLGINTHYKNGEVADGLGLATAEHFREIVERVYGWKAKDDTMYEQLQDPNHVVTLKNIAWLKKGSHALQPLKLTHFEITEEGMPIFFKYAVAPLFPALVKDTQVERLYDQMRSQGVEQVVFQSGSKGANPTATTIHTSNGEYFTGIKEDFRLNPFTIDSELIKVQTEVPTKLNTSIAVGNQLIKNMMANLDVETELKNYLFQNANLTGKEMYSNVETAIKNILQEQLTLTLGELGYDKKTKTFNKVNIKKFLKAQMDIETEADLLHLLDTNLPLETIPNFTQRAFPVIAKYIHKNAGKIYTNGSSVVQIANIGFDKISKKQKEGIFFFDNEKRDLTPPIPKTYKNLTKQEKDQLGAVVDDDTIIYWSTDTFNDEGHPLMATTKVDKGYKMRINKARILLPFSQLFVGNDISYNEFMAMYKAGKVDKEIFTNAIGYRIPNQSMASIDSFEIVGILPPIAGDQAVVYNEITTKTGSDFDIDKMYMMLPMWKTVGEVIVVPDENKPLLKAIEDLIKKKWIPLTDFHTIDMLKTWSGNRILRTLWENDPELKRELLAIKPSLEKTMPGPIEFLAKNQELIMPILQKNGKTIKDTDGSDLLLSKIMKTTLAAHQKAWKANEPIVEEKRTKLNAIKEKYGWKKPQAFKYVTGKDNRFNKNSKNRLIELYASILEAEVSYDDLMSPLDSDKIKKAIYTALHEKALAMKLTTIEDEAEFFKENKESGVEQMFPAYLVAARVNVLEGKALIAMMANNMTDLGESQKTGFGLSYDMGLKTTDLSSIYEIGKKGNKNAKISKTLSYAMNAAVDAAKDAYIIDGNFNTYTGNAAIMMIRMGMSMADIFTILTNETIMQFSIDKQNAKGKTADISPDYKNEKLDDLASAMISKIGKAKGNDIFNVVSRKDFKSNTLEKKDEILGFWHLLQETAKEFNNAVVAMKSDSNGPGKNLATMVALDNRIERMLEDSVVGSGEKWFRGGINHKNRKFNPDINGDPDMKVLGAFANNTLFLMKELSAQLFLEATPKVITSVNQMSAVLGNALPTDEGSIKLIYNYLYPFLLYKTGHPLYSMDKMYGELTEEEWLLERFPTILQKKRMSTSNAFLKQLIVDTKGKENLIRFGNSENYAAEEKLIFKEALIDLMKSDLKFMDNLVKYSYLTTGFKSTPFSFHQFFPANYFINNFHGKAVQDFIENKMGTIDESQALSLIAMNNWQNYKIVRAIGKAPMEANHLDSGTEYTVTDEKALRKITIPNPYGDKAFAPFISKKWDKKLSLYILKDIVNGFPVYKRNKELKNDISTFKAYNYNFTYDPVHLTYVHYYSKVAQLHKDNNAGHTTINRDVFNAPIEEIDGIFTTSGKSIRELGIDQEDWNDLSEELKQEIIKCR